MQKIVPHLWYDKEAKEAALFYISLFDRSKLLNVAVIENTPSGDAEIVNFELAGQQFTAISAGPYFRFNPSISLMVACDSVEEVNAKWKALLEGGTELMPLGEYPFSKWYGWVQDRYGLSWQLMLADSGQAVQKITPNLLFSSDSCGKAEEAVKYYAEVFEDSDIGIISRYGLGEVASSKAKVNYAAFKLCGIDFSAMDNAFDVDYTFNEAFSLVVNCKDQKEIDYFWDRLSAVPEAEQCGWIKDKFGVSWQIVPENMDEILFNGSRDEIQRVTEAFLKMKKFDLDALVKARLGTDNIGEEDMENKRITIETIIKKPIDQVWKKWVLPQHIMEWNNASEDWYTPSAENDLRVGGSFNNIMAARDGSFSFDFSGIYDEVIFGKKIAYTIGDGRKVDVDFIELDGCVKVVETFEAEETNSLEMQRAGWQAILDNFKRYAEMF